MTIMLLGIAVIVILFVYHAVRLISARKSRLVTIGSSVQGVPKTIHYPKVTFLVAGWNAALDLEEFIASFHGLDLNKQLVLCVGGADDSFQLSRTLASPDVVVLEQVPGMGKQRALQASLPYTTGDWVFLTDIDSRLSNKSVQKMMRALGTGGASCVTGGMAPLSRQRRDPFVMAQWGIERYGSERTPEFTTGILGANTILTRQALRDSGDFSQDAPSGTDYTLAKELIAAGHRILHVKDAEVETEFSQSLRSYIRRRARWLRNVLVLGRRYRCFGEVRSVLITIVLSYLYPVLFLAGFTVWWFWVVFVLLFMHSALNRLRYGLLTEVPQNLKGIMLTVVGDLSAGVLAGYEASRGSIRW